MFLAQKIVALLEERKQMNTADICRVTNAKKDAVNYALKGLKSRKRVYVYDWTYANGKNPMAVWALGNKQSAQRPRAEPKVTKEGFKARNSLVVNIKPDVAAEWMMDANYLQAKVYRAILRNGERGVRQNGSLELRAA